MNGDDDLPDGAVAYREYEVPLASGRNASSAFTLGKLNVDSVPANLAKQQNAKAYGLVSILDYPDAPQYPVVWLQTDTMLGIVVADDDKELSEELRQIV